MFFLHCAHNCFQPFLVWTSPSFPLIANAWQFHAGFFDISHFLLLSSIWPPTSAWELDGNAQWTSCGTRQPAMAEGGGCGVCGFISGIISGSSHGAFCIWRGDAVGGSNGGKEGTATLTWYALFKALTTAAAAADAAACDAVMAVTYTISSKKISVISGSTALAEALAQKDRPPLAAAFVGIWRSRVLGGLGTWIEFPSLGGRILWRNGLIGGGGGVQLNVVQLTTSCWTWCLEVLEDFSSSLSNGLFTHPLPTFANDGFPFLEVPLQITSVMPFATFVIGLIFWWSSIQAICCCHVPVVTMIWNKRRSFLQNRETRLFEQ